MVHKGIILLLIIVAFSMTTGFQQASSQTNWQVFISKEGGFKLLLPGKPAEQTIPINSPSGSSIFHTFASIGKDGAIYTFAYFDLPGFKNSPDQITSALDTARNGHIASTNGKLISEKKISLGEYPGREVEAKTPVAIVTSRIYLVKNRMCLTSVFVPEAKAGSETIGKNASKFLDSFRILPTQ